ncbi:MAG: hypothetical protein ABI120_05605 [Gemmatimonadaceae bacterium]
MSILPAGPIVIEAPLSGTWAGDVAETGSVSLPSTPPLHLVSEKRPLGDSAPSNIVPSL